MGGPGMIYENLRTSDAAVARVKAMERAAHHKARFMAIRGTTVEVPADAFAAGREWALAQVARIRRDVADRADRKVQQSLIYDLALERALSDSGLVSAEEVEDDDLPPDVEARLRGIRAGVQGLTDTPPEYTEPFSRTAEAYLKDRQRPGASGRMTEQTVAQMEAVYRLYRDHTEDAPLLLTTRKVASRFFDKLKRLDANWGRSRKTKGRTLDDLLALSDREDAKPLSDRTLFRYCLALTQVWDWAKGREDIEGNNPFKGLAAKGKNDENANAPWTDDAIVAYFAAHPDSSKKGKPDPFFWLPRMALLSGMRLEEICQLTRADIIEGDGVKCFDVKKGKTSAATRAVPIHRDLLPLLEVAPSTGFLFPHLVVGGVDKKRSAQIGKQLGRRFKAINPEGSTFHAFRKNVVSALDRHRVRESDIAQIVGHGKKGITFKIYSPHGIPITLRKELVDLLRLPEGA